MIILISAPFGALAQGQDPATAATTVHESTNTENTETTAIHDGETSHEELGPRLPLWSIIPFLGILLSIALFPLLAPHFWHHHFGKVSIFWALLFAFPFLFVFKGEGIHEILHIYLIDYIPFIILLWSLFTVSGGILVRGDLVGKPSTNLLILLIGTFLSSWIGTTGSAMVLIRPLLRANANRKNKTHIVVFFIFLVANIGGSLTPLGDPPLFLGFLHGVPFFYTFRLLPDMIVASVILLFLFYFMDRFFYAREKPEDIVVTGTRPFSIAGKRNFIFLAGVIGGVLLSGFWRPGTVHVFGIPMGIQNMARDSILIIMALLSMKFTPGRWRKENGFSWFPIIEVALLFAGIFMTIIPALAILKAGTDGSLAFLIRAVQEPQHYFWVTGILSSFLDNAPTYLTFMNSALGQFYAGIPESQAVHQLIAEHSIYLKAISVGAVFMGANTYIGNAPNFMVKSIAEENGVPMPSFFGYIFKYSLPILIPTFIIIHLIFFR
ncbi:MAG: sodium:proton antiporter [Holophagae bacterium]|nr:sodium:proton antiporter [Holophagae bacterium]